MIKINLLPKEIQEKGKGMEWVILGGALVGIYVIFALSYYLMKAHDYKQDMARKTRWSKQLAEKKTEVAQVEQLDKQKRVLDAKKNTVIQLLRGRLLYPKLMENFYSTLPIGIWIDDLVLTEAGQNVKMVSKSNSISVNAIAEWLETLESRPERFRDISLTAIDAKKTKGEATTYAFSMTFVYIPPPPGV